MPNRLKIAMDFGADELRSQGPRRRPAELGLAPRRPRPQPQGRRRARALARAHQLQALRGVRLRRPHPQVRDRAADDLRRQPGRDRQGAGRRGGGDPGGGARQAARGLHDARLRAGRRLQHRPLQHPVLARTRATSGSARRRATRRAACCSPTRSTRSTSRSSNADGSPAGDGDVELKLYKVEWRWWWEKGDEDLATWAEASVHSPLSTGVVKVKNGAGRLGAGDQVPRVGPLPARRRRQGRRPPGRRARSTSTGRAGPAAARRSRAAAPPCWPSPRTSPSTRPARR